MDLSNKPHFTPNCAGCPVRMPGRRAGCGTGREHSGERRYCARRTHVLHWVIPSVAFLTGALPVHLPRAGRVWGSHGTISRLNALPCGDARHDGEQRLRLPLRLLGPTQHSSLALSCLLPALGLVKLLFVDAVVLADSTFYFSAAHQLDFCTTPLLPATLSPFLVHLVYERVV